MYNDMILRVKRVRPHANLPVRSSKGAGGYDLSACKVSADDTLGWVIPAGERLMIPTGISMAIPPDHFGQIAPRSGLAHKKGIAVLGGIIDSDYRGEIQVILLNTGSEPVFVASGDRIAQIIFVWCSAFVMSECAESEALDITERAEAGLGSTGS